MTTGFWFRKFTNQFSTIVTNRMGVLGFFGNALSDFVAAYPVGGGKDDVSCNSQAARNRLSPRRLIPPFHASSELKHICNVS
jgi:hypothetical protein